MLHSYIGCIDYCEGYIYYSLYTNETQLYILCIYIYIIYIYIYTDPYSERRWYIFHIHLLTDVYEKYTPLIQIHAYRLLTTHAPI